MSNFNGDSTINFKGLSKQVVNVEVSDVEIVFALYRIFGFDSLTWYDKELKDLCRNNYPTQYRLNATPEEIKTFKCIKYLNDGNT